MTDPYYRRVPTSFVFCPRCNKTATLTGDEEWQCDCPPPSMLENAMWLVQDAIARLKLSLAGRLDNYARRLRGDS